VPGNGDVPVLNSVGNRMDMPRRVAADLNRFSRPLLGTLGPQGEHPMPVLPTGRSRRTATTRRRGIIGIFCCEYRW